MDKNLALIGGIGALLLAAKKLKAQQGSTDKPVITYDDMTSIHNLIIQEATPNIEEWVIEADKHQLWELLPLYGFVTDYQIFCDDGIEKRRLAWSFDPVQSLILLANVESGGGAYLNVIEIGKNEHGETLYRATAEDVGAFHLNKKIWPHLLNYNRFTIFNYAVACVIAARQNTRYTFSQIINKIANRVYRDRNDDLFECVINGDCDSIALYNFSKEIGAELYNDRWNRNADKGSEAYNNFTNKFAEMPQLVFKQTIEITFTLQIEGLPPKTCRR